MTSVVAVSSALHSQWLNSLLLLIFCNYALGEKLVQLVFPMAYYWHILPTVVILWIVFCWWYSFKAPESMVEVVQIAVVILFAALVFINIAVAIPDGLAKVQAEKEFLSQSGVPTGEEIGSATPEGDAACPNIYLMVFDEYASFMQLEKYWGYDNSSFKNFLMEKGFMVSDESRNESGSTKSVLTNLMNINYIVTAETEDSVREKYLQSPELLEILAKQGYQSVGIGDTEWLGVESLTGISSDDYATSIEGYTLELLFLQNTALYPFYNKDYSSDEERIRDTLEDMETIDVEPSSSTFILSYLKAPHQPFVFDAEGGLQEYKNYNNWDDPQYYLGQLEYITSEIQVSISNILENDSDCIIFLCSDHGARSGPYNEPYSVKTTVLNAIYYRGETDISLLNQSNVNTLRLILNKLFSMDLTLLEVPYEG